MSGNVSGGLSGKSFYLHDVKRHLSVTLTDIISRLGGKVDSFLTKDVNVVVTGIKEAHNDLPVDSSCAAGRKQSGTPKPLVCGSRGKALLEKAIHSNDKSWSSVLADARSWGVKVYHVDGFLKIINHLDQKMRTAKKKRSKQITPQVKAGVLRSPYLKVEDCSRKFRPYYAQTLNFPSMSYSGKCSPFELLRIPQKTDRSKDEDPSKDHFGKKEPTSSCHRLQVPLSASATPKGPTKKSSGYCECCHVPFKDQHEHLESEMHRSFIQKDSNYALVDQLTATMKASFVCIPNEEVDPTLMKSSAGLSPLHLSHLTEMVQDTVSENGESLQTPLVQDFGHLPSITELFTPTLDNTEHSPEPIKSLSSLSTHHQNITSHLYTMQNNCPDAFDHDRAGLYVTCTTKVNEFQPDARCMDLNMSSIDKNPKSFSFVTSSEAKLNMLTLSSKIPCTTSGGEYEPETQNQREGAHGHLVFHMPRNLEGACSNTVFSQNQKLVWNQGLSMCLNSPKILLQREEDGNLQRCGQFVFDHRLLLSTKRSLQGIDRSPEFGMSYFPLSCFLPFSNLSDYPFSIGNVKKRDRSFTQSPKPAKRRKICHNERQNPSWDSSTPCKRSSVPSTLALAVSKVDFTTKMNNRPVDEISFADQIQTWHCQKNYFTSPSTHCLPNKVGQQDNATSKLGDHVEQKMFPEDPVESRVTTHSSELDLPQLVPFYHDDNKLQRHQYNDPPELFPFFFQTPEDNSHASVSKVTNSSFVAHSGASVCIESALVPNLTWSPASSESDWDSGLLTWLANAVPLQAKTDNDDMGLLLQKPHTDMQDGSYASRLCSILQPS
ncbi:uncharacterized protein dbf4b [Danio aesculapii]|uniref:uncharacterized protein dbf4b n=1 Tax=Danio aesculapii TaxID=1142201 RepID=UPI0024C067F9|nr:uncharacterized protein dbf4b [Danio aesculapii]